MSEFKGYKKGYTEKDFKNDKQTVTTLGRYDWDKADYRYAEQARKYREARMRVQKQTEFNLKNGIEVDASRNVDTPNKVYQAVCQYVRERIKIALDNLIDYDLNDEIVSHRVRGYDADWCSYDIPSEVQTQLDEGIDIITKAETDLLMMYAGGMTASRKRGEH